MQNRFMRKLETFGPLPDADRRLIEDIIGQPRNVDARQDIVREGDNPSNVHLILDGFACRSKFLEDGSRQIVAYLLPGDFCDLHVFILKEMDHNITTLSRCTVVDIPRDRVLEMTNRPALRRALWWVTLVDEAILREWIVMVGRRPPIKGIAHLICEIYARLETVGISGDDRFRLPITQQELADTMGTSKVHTNRELMKLRRLKLMTWEKDQIVILDPDRLREFSGFRANYLHIGEEDRLPSESVRQP